MGYRGIGNKGFQVFLSDTTYTCISSSYYSNSDDSIGDRFYRK